MTPSKGVQQQQLQLILIIMRSSILVGGQAVINGVMMRVPGAYSTAVRVEDGSIKSNY